MIASLDANENSTIHYTEFLAAMMTHTIATNEGHIRAAFDRLDRDNSGFITLENLKATLGESYDGVPMEQILKEVDTHHTGNISYEEFQVYVQGGLADQTHQELVLNLAAEQRKSVVSQAGPAGLAAETAPAAAATAPAPASAEAPAATAEAAPAAAPAATQQGAQPAEAPPPATKS